MNPNESSMSSRPDLEPDTCLGYLLGKTLATTSSHTDCKSDDICDQSDSGDSGRGSTLEMTLPNAEASCSTVMTESSNGHEPNIEVDGTQLKTQDSGSDEDTEEPVEEGEYEVEEILDHIHDKGKDWYYVKWKDWEDEFNTWEEKSNLANCPLLLEKFHSFNEESSVKGQKESRDPSKSRNRRKLSASSERPAKHYRRVSSREKLDRWKETLPKEYHPAHSLLVTYMREHSESTRKKKKLADNAFDELVQKLLNSSNPSANLKESVFTQMCIRELEVRHLEQKEKLKAWQDSINSVIEDTPKIVVENNVDLEGPPEKFAYVNQYVPGENIIIPDDPLVGCNCTTCSMHSPCCAEQAGHIFAYDRYGRIRVRHGQPVYECNKHCKCDSTCQNRIVQNGSKIKLCIFRTSSGCGWGVKTLEFIKKNTFVTTYVGEVITSEEAEKRGQKYDAEGRTYLFDLDFNTGNEDEQCYTVDAAMYGNVSHFINHSCEPNLEVYNVWINCMDPNLPQLVLFASKDIKRGEEITFDYLMFRSASNNSSNEKITNHCLASPSKFGQRSDGSNSIAELPSDKPRVACKCGSVKCRKYLF